MTDRADLLHLDRALYPEERRLLFKKTPGKNAGYAATPGTGPANETCKTCQHYSGHRTRAGNKFRKCGLMEATWTFGPGTDIKASSPACAKWQRSLKSSHGA